MEDLHVHDVSEEASSATLGAMLPQVPPDKTIIKKKEGIDDMIPEELMEFIYNEDATYTYAVEGAISNLAHNVKDKFSNSAHAKDVKASTLPFKVRQLTIERATLRAKISWMGKRKSKQEKVLKYKRRLVEVEQALRRIQNTVNSADEKKQIEAQIKELDMQVTKSVTTDLEQRGVLEAVNEFIRAGKEEGLLLSFIPEFTMDDLYPIDEEVIEEGANLQTLDIFVDAKLSTKRAVKKAKKAIKKGNYEEAAKYVAEVRKNISKVEKKLKDYPKESVTTNLLGMVTGWIVANLVAFVKSFGVGFLTGVSTGVGVSVSAASIDGDSSEKAIGAITIGAATGSAVNILGNAIVGITNIIGVLRRFKANLDEKKSQDRAMNMTFINGLYNRCLVYLKDTGKALDKLEAALKKAKSKKDLDKELNAKEEKETKESVKLAVQAFEADYLTESEFLDLIVEAKKPDDGMMPILSKLHEKGYKTKYSCAGHKDSGSKDRNDDGIVNGKLASAARIMFNGDYDFPDPPKHWGFKTVDGKDYLYVLQYSNDGKNPDAFDEWKNKYMASLDRWVDSLPNAKKEDDKVVEDTPSEDKKDQSNEVKESVDFDVVIDNEMAELMMDLSNNF